MKKEIIQAKHLIKTFGGNQEPILKNIDVSIYEEDFTVIMGSSGSGKSTLLYALSGMDKISNGEILFRNKKLNTFSEKQMAKLRSESFGFIFQQANLVSNLTLFENVLVAGYLDKTKDSASVQREVNQLFQKMAIEKAKNRLPGQVSGGEAQRAAIARAVVHHPNIVFADEPTGALNKQNTESVLDLLTALNEEGQSILMVTHDIRSAIRGTRVIYLEDGEIISDLEFPKYQKETAKEREKILSKWLLSLNW